MTNDDWRLTKLHIPVLRYGTPYKSLDVTRLSHHQTGEPFVEISQANSGMIRRDLVHQKRAREKLEGFSSADLQGMCQRAADHFAEATLPLGDQTQSPEDYISQVSATTGLPHVMARRNMEKIRSVLSNMNAVVYGLTRGLDPRLFDFGVVETERGPLSFYRRTDALGVVLPSNSPGVHSLWLPAVAMKTPLVLKPGSAEPWTPYRIIQALIRAGVPADVFCFYPTDHAGAGEILRECGRSMLFGDATTTRPWVSDPRVEIHGPGYSKVVIGADCIDRWQTYLDVMVASILDNCGRSCINASGIWIPSHAQEIAEALADRLARVGPRAPEDEAAELAPFADQEIAARISGAIDQALEEPGARDVSVARRGSERLVVWQGCSYLLPTIVVCDTADHPLANREYLFPFASVVHVPEQDLPEALGPSLVVTLITGDTRLIRRFLSSPLVDRLNLGAMSTTTVRWDQPHEGNLFDHLYARRAIQQTA